MTHPRTDGPAWRNWAVWIFALSAMTALMLVFRARLDKAHVALLYLLVVLGASAAGGRVIGLTMAGAAFLAFNYLFLPPYFTLVIADPIDWLVLVTFLITGIVAAQLLYRARREADVAIARALEVDRLATLGAETLAAPSATDALQAIAEVIRTSLDAATVELFRKDIDGALHRATVAGREHVAIGDTTTASWFGDRVRLAAVLPDGTTRLEPASLVGLEVISLDRSLDVRGLPAGVLRVVFTPSRALTADSARLLEALAYYAALGVERVRLEANAERAEAERRMESLRNALFMSVSHDLRTPLTTIKALAHELSLNGTSSAAKIIEEESDHLDAMVADLLDLSRLHAGGVPIARAVNTIDDLIGASLQRAHGAIGSRAVAVTLPEQMLVASFDLTQSMRIIVNLLENAAKYTPKESSIELSARREGEWVMVDVEDNGPGVTPGEEEHIFEPFYRPSGTPPDVRGTGLGLSISRGLAEAQGGTLRYHSRAGGGAVFSLMLPAVINAPLTAE